MPYEILSGFTTAAGATLTALTMGSGDSLVVRNSVNPKLLTAWVDSQATGVLRIRSPLLHDATQGIRLQHVASEVDPLTPLGIYQPLVKQDTLTVELSGSAVAGDLDSASLLVHYDSLPGSEGRFIDEAELRDRVVQIFSVENTLALGTAGGYSGSEAINAEFDFFKAEYDYALIGYLTNVEATSIGWRGPDTGNLRIGGPGNELDKHITADWFVRLSRMYGLPMIPVFSASNKAATTLDGVQDENGVDPTVTHIYAQLTPEARKEGAATNAPTSQARRVEPRPTFAPPRVVGAGIPLLTR